MWQVLETCKENMAAQQWAAVIADLSPVLLSEDLPAAHALRADKKVFLDALHMLQVNQCWNSSKTQVWDSGVFKVVFSPVLAASGSQSRSCH
jgi:hypothetical protein